MISFGDCGEFCNNQTVLGTSSLPLIIGLLEDIMLHKYNKSIPKVPLAFYSERMNKANDGGCFNRNREIVMKHLERGFGTLSEFNATHIFVSTWYGLENDTSAVSFV